MHRRGPTFSGVCNTFLCVACQHPTHFFFHEVGVVWECSLGMSSTAEPACTRNPLCLSTLIQLHASHPPLLCFSSSSCSCAFILLANLLYLPTEFSAWWKPPARGFSWSRCLSALRHVDIIWSEKINFFFEVQSYLPDSGLRSGFPGEFSSSHMEPFPWPKANECGTSPDWAMKTGRKDAHPGRLLTCSDIYSEAWREALLLVQLPSQMGEISQSLSEDLMQTVWLFFPSVFSVFKVYWGVS